MKMILNALGTTSIALVCLSVVLLWGTAAWAEDSITDSVATNYSGATSIEIVGIDNAKVKVSGDNVNKEGTTPTIVTLPNKDAYISVEVNVDGAKPFSKKYRVKRGHLTKVSLKRVAGAKAAEPKAKKSETKTTNYIVKFYSGVNKCRGKYRAYRRLSTKVQVLDGNTTVAEVVLKPGQRVSKELPGKAYRVRIYAWIPKSKSWELLQSLETTIKKDGQPIGYGC